jgi:plasmid stabilization system protein ParE
MWTESAWRDLEEVADYIAKDSSHYAAAFILEARDAARTLAYMAERGRVVPEFNDPIIRELFYKELPSHLSGSQANCIYCWIYSWCP